MSEGTHVEGKNGNKFCALRKPKCPTGEYYKDNGQPTWTGKSQAHHLLCVAEVTKFIGKDKEVKSAVENTTWCINRKKNMLGLPVGSATIKSYCDQAISGVALEDLKAPDWENWPQHTTDHPDYNIEVEDALNTNVAAAVKKNLAEHEDPSGDLAGVLDDESGAFLGLLVARGERVGPGTHKAWQKGAKQPTSDWYEPFSMAASPTKRTFPGMGFNAALANKILKMWKTFASWA